MVTAALYTWSFVGLPVHWDDTDVALVAERDGRYDWKTIEG